MTIDIRDIDIRSIDLSGITEDEAITLTMRLFRNFRWVGSFFTMDDLRRRWDGDFIREGVEPAELTEDILNDILSSYQWRKGIDEVTGEDIGELVNDLISEVRTKHDLI